MTLPANIRLNIGAPFPARVQGASYFVVSKANGIWTIAPNYTLLAQLFSVPDPTIKQVVIYDTVSGVFSTISIAAFVAAALGSNYRIITAAGNVNVLASDTTLLINNGVATSIILPLSSTRNGLALTVKDYAGIANTDNITFVPAGSETIDGFSGSAAAANGVALIDINYGKKTLWPLTSGGWYI